ncbi:extracellular solute-binding protein [Amycolatopsis suaedae]|uniref:extracellular solute-binding protein n=1 Tax=Amycolatopsis suaedae TaxID=2510978 RepID=UPI001F0FD6E4|nr:extracellular solute-binding protein [Amycolatopsis suaedae]
MRRWGIAAAVVLLLGGCAPGSSDPTAGREPTPGRLSYVYFTDGPDEQVTRSLIAEYEKTRGVRVDLQIVPFSELQQQLQARLASGNAPDVARVHNLGAYRGELADLGPIGGEFLDQAQQAIRGPGGETLAVPSDLTMNGPLVNTDQFARAGVALPPPDRPWTWDELLANARRVQQAVGAPHAIAFDKSGHRLAGLFSQFGTTYFGPGGGVAFDPVKAERAVRLFVDLNQQGLMYKDFWIESGTKYRGANEIFLRQDAPVYFSGNWQVSQLAKSAKFGWAAIPNPCAQRCGGYPGGKFMIVFNQSPNQRAAAEFVAFMNSRAAQERYAREAKFLPTRKDLIASGVSYPDHGADMAVFLGDVARTDPDAFADNYHPAFDTAARAAVKEFAAAIAGQQSAADTVERIRAEAAEAAEASSR